MSTPSLLSIISPDLGISICQGLSVPQHSWGTWQPPVFLFCRGKGVYARDCSHTCRVSALPLSQIPDSAINFQRGMWLSAQRYILTSRSFKGFLWSPVVLGPLSVLKDWFPFTEKRKLPTSQNLFDNGHLSGKKTGGKDQYWHGEQKQSWVWWGFWLALS